MSKLILTIIVSLLFVANASASNWPNAKLDQTASAIAGHSVNVYCENDWNTWMKSDAPNAWGYTFDPSFTSTIWIHPAPCMWMHVLLDKHPNVETNYYVAGIGLHVLIHESVHQRGGIFSDCSGIDLGCESRTECEAVKLDREVFVNLFGVPEKVTVRRGVKGHRRNVRIANPNLDQMMRGAMWLHDGLPNEYKGVCV